MYDFFVHTNFLFIYYKILDDDAKNSVDYSSKQKLNLEDLQK